MAENEKLEQTAKSKKREDKPAKKAKPGVFARIGKWLREMKAELKKVVWPTRKQTLNNTVIVIICCVIVGICIALFDLLANGVIGALLSLAGKG